MYIIPYRESGQNPNGFPLVKKARKILKPDGEEQDAYVLGITEPVETFTGVVLAVIHRLDDVEDKWVVVPPGTTYTKEEIEEQISFQEQYFHFEIQMEPS